MGKNTTDIRQAIYGEASVLSDIISASFQDVAQRFHLTPENCPKHPSNCTEKWVQNDFKRGVVFYLLEVSGSPIGSVAMEKADPDQFYLERLSVLPEFRRKGFGRRLVDHVIYTAKSLGARRIGIGIISKQTELKLWYRKIGFVEKEEKAFPHLPFIVSFMAYDL